MRAIASRVPLAGQPVQRLRQFQRVEVVAL
jgi:hypothetical protein